MAALSKSMIGGDPVLPGTTTNEDPVLPPVSPAHFPLGALYPDYFFLAMADIGQKLLLRKSGN
jgi:hypothetical protein